MSWQKKLIISAVMLFAFLFSACDFDLSSSGKTQAFDWELREIWISEQGSIYQGEIEITFNTIKITGYYEDQTPILGNDNQRPFRDIPKGVALKGYSENGRIFIEGHLPEGIPYELASVGAHYPQIKILRFTFSGRTEALRIK
jgi:hypothetical protein